MGLVLVASGTVSGALVGLVGAVALAPFIGASGPASTGLVVALVAAGVGLDAIQLATGRLRPPSSNRQVPQAWGRLFVAPVVAVLYGARLGVGPLTILSTWTWWSVTIAAALSGPMASVLVGATFGLIRLLVTVLVSSVFASLGADGRNPSPRDSPSLWFNRLRAGQRTNWIAINGIGVSAVLAVALAGCGSSPDEIGDRAAGNGPPASTVDHPDPTDNETTDRTDSSTGQSVAGEPEATTDGAAAPHGGAAPMPVWPGEPVAGSAESGGSASRISQPDRSEPADENRRITAVDLEDIVRTATDDQTNSNNRGPTGATGGLDAAAASTAPIPSSEPAALAGALVATIDGYQPVGDPNADRALNLAAAAAIQPDPTEELALLETRGFQRGWTRAFRNATNDVAVASVYQFEDATEAEFYLEDGLITIGGYGGKFFDIDGQPGVRGFVQYFTESDEFGSEELVSLGAAFQTGPRWYLVYFVGSVDTVNPDVLIPVIAAQRELALG